MMRKIVRQKEDELVQQQLLRENAKAEAIKQGFDAGFTEGKKVALARFFSAELLLSRIISSAREILSSTISEITKNVLESELKIQPETIESRIEGILNQLRNQKLVQVFVHPTELKKVEGYKQNLERIVYGSQLVVLEDSELAVGDIRIITELGTIERFPRVHLQDILSIFQARPDLLENALLDLLNQKINPEKDSTAP